MRRYRSTGFQPKSPASVGHTSSFWASWHAVQFVSTRSLRKLWLSRRISCPIQDVRPTVIIGINPRWQSLDVKCARTQRPMTGTKAKLRENLLLVVHQNVIDRFAVGSDTALGHCSGLSVTGYFPFLDDKLFTFQVGDPLDGMIVDAL